jgi:hypothetical protein
MSATVAAVGLPFGPIEFEDRLAGLGIGGVFDHGDARRAVAQNGWLRLVGLDDVLVRQQSTLHQLINDFFEGFALIGPNAAGTVLLEAPREIMPPFVPDRRIGSFL